MPPARGLIVAGVLLAAAIVVPATAAQDDRPRRAVNLTLQDEGCPAGPDRFCVQPGNVTLEEGTDLVLRVTNEGRIAHNLTFADETAPSLAKHGMNRTLAADETQRLQIPWPAIEEAGQPNATLECGRDGHAALGEVFTIHVPSLAESDERPQPGFGTLGALAAVSVGAWAARRR